MKRVFVALKKEAQLWHSSLPNKNNLLIYIFCLKGDPALKTNVAEKLVRNKCREIYINTEDQSGISFEINENIKKELSEIDEPFSLFVIGSEMKEYIIESSLKDISMMQNLGYHSNFKVGKVRLRSKNDLSAQQLSFDFKEVKKENPEAIREALRKAEENETQVTDEEETIEMIMNQIFGTKFMREAAEEEMSPLAAAKAILTGLLSIRLNKHIKFALEEELDKKAAFTLQTLVIKSNDKDTFLKSWKTVYPHSAIHFSSDEDFIKIKKETEYYNSVCVMLYGADLWSK